MFKKNINKNLKFSIYLVITIIITLCFSISIQSLLATWTAPTALPPEGNISGLLNEGINNQTKLGGLTIGGAFKADSIDNTLVVDASNNRVGIGTSNPSQKLDVAGYVKGQSGLCIGNDCRNIWPSGDITAVNAGIGLSGGGTFGSVTLDADTDYLQRRISNSCSVGSSIRAISYTGAVTCETDDISPWTQNGSRIYYNSGNVGIGTSNPSQKLDVAGYVKGQSGLCIGNDCKTNWPVGGDNLGNHTATQNLDMANYNVNGTGEFKGKWLHLSAGGNNSIMGNLGIGTTNPTQKLDVNGNVNIRGSQIRMNNGNSYYYGDSNNLASRSATGDFYIQNSSGSPGRLITGALCLSGDCKTSWPTYQTPSLECITKAASGGVNVTVSCPSGYQRTGCSMKYNNGNNGTWGTSVKPVGNRGCSCSNGYTGNTTCYAYCCKIISSGYQPL